MIAAWRCKEIGEESEAFGGQSEWRKLLASWAYMFQFLRCDSRKDLKIRLFLKEILIYKKCSINTFPLALKYGQNTLTVWINTEIDIQCLQYGFDTFYV